MRDTPPIRRELKFLIAPLVGELPRWLSGLRTHFADTII